MIQSEHCGNIVRYNEKWLYRNIIDVYAPYQPVLTTDLLMPADYRGQQGYATSYGKKMVNNKMYLRGRIVD